MPETSSASPQYGIQPDTGAYRTSVDSPGFLNDTDIAELEYEPCETVTGAIQTKGTGGIFLNATDDGFSWQGNGLTIYRPAGQITLDERIEVDWNPDCIDRQKIHGSQKTVMLAVAQERS